MKAMREPWSPARHAPIYAARPPREGDLPLREKMLPQSKDEWKLVFGLNDENAEDIMAMQRAVTVAPDPVSKRKALAAMQVRIDRLRRERNVIRQKRAALAAEEERLKRGELELMKTFGKMHNWAEEMTRPLRLERCQETRLSELIHELKTIPSDALKSAENEGGVPQTLHSLRQAQILLIEHDWAGAMAKADLDADFRLPYDVTVFEMKMGGRSLIAEMTLQADAPFLTLFISSERGWLRTEGVWWQNGRWEFDPEGPFNHPKLAKFEEVVLYVGAQVRACCIALDAEVATATVIRALHSVRNARDLTVRKPYHVVSLARRERAARLSEPGSTGRHMRLHFRRGHWRHFENHKTWIKWMLVGDPDLGFVDKHYKL